MPQKMCFHTNTEKQNLIFRPPSLKTANFGICFDGTEEILHQKQLNNRDAQTRGTERCSVVSSWVGMHEASFIYHT